LVYNHRRLTSPPPSRVPDASFSMNIVSYDCATMHTRRQ
uniref:Uncharacterized protein n=1 Tax=Parascaris univalens TaxID=6257 RepID=A0A914ZR09_PARUN